MKKIKAHLQDKNDLNRTLIRISHEIIEKNPDLSQIAIVGIRTRGEIIAQRITQLVEKISNIQIDNGTIDVTFYRDDFKSNLDSPKVGPSDIKFDVSNRNIILIDDVLYTGRTIRAAMDEVFSYGRPASIQLGVLVDRGHRELPIKTDFVGKNYPTSINEHIHVHIKEIDGTDEVLLMDYSE